MNEAGPAAMGRFCLDVLAPGETSGRSGRNLFDRQREDRAGGMLEHVLHGASGEHFPERTLARREHKDQIRVDLFRVLGDFGRRRSRTADA